MMMIIWFRFTVKLIRKWEFILRNYWTSMERTFPFQSISRKTLSISPWIEKWSLKKSTVETTSSSNWRRRINSPKTSMKEQGARKSNDNSESRCSTHWWWHRASGGISCRCRNRKRRRRISRRRNSHIWNDPEESYEQRRIRTRRLRTCCFKELVYYLCQRSMCRKTSSIWIVGKRRKRTKKAVNDDFWLRFLDSEECRRNLGVREWIKSGSISRSEDLLMRWGGCENHGWFSVTQLDFSFRNENENWSKMEKVDYVI